MQTLVRMSGLAGMLRHSCALALIVACTPAEPPSLRWWRPLPDEAYGKPTAVMADPDPEADPAPKPAVVAASASSEFEVAGNVAKGYGEDAPTPPVRSVPLGVKLTVKWTAQIGRTTFRTTMAMVGDAIVVGTHGASLNGKNEASDGVVLLEASTGTRRRLIQTPGAGDRDVGGIAVDGQTVYFSTDNGLIVAATLDGKVLWKATASGKVRPAPALGNLNDDGQVDVVVGDEAGTLHALDGATGAVLWQASTGPNSYDAKGFIGSAAIADLDGDGRDDVVAGARDGILTGYVGRDGSVIWQATNDSGIHASPVVADFDHDGKPEVLGAWSYGNVGIYDGKTGVLRWGTLLRQDDGGIEGLFGTPTPLAGKPGVLLAPTAWWGKADGCIGVGVDARAFKAFDGRTSASAVVTDLDDDGVLEGIIGSEAGALAALRADGGYSKLATLRAPIEAPALIADVDGNGTFEVLVASNDGKLTCYETGSKSRPVVPRFRGESPHNRGDLGKVSLGWHSAAVAGAAPDPAPGGGIRVDYLLCCTALQEAATRAPTPQNRQLLKAAAQCQLLAADAQPRSAALGTIQAAAGDADLPDACR